jgi:hypothetical protein
MGTKRMINQPVLVKAVAIQTITEAFAAGWRSGRRRERPPEWIPATVMAFVGNGKAAIRLGDGTVHEVPLDAIQAVGALASQGVDGPSSQAVAAPLAPPPPRAPLFRPAGTDDAVARALEFIAHLGERPIAPAGSNPDTFGRRTMLDRRDEVVAEQAWLRSSDVWRERPEQDWWDAYRYLLGRIEVLYDHALGGDDKGAREAGSKVGEAVLTLARLATEMSSSQS